VHPELALEQVQYVVDCIRDFLLAAPEPRLAVAV
jgi:hypothetical protein